MTRLPSFNVEPLGPTRRCRRFTKRSFDLTKPDIDAASLWPGGIRHHGRKISKPPIFMMSQKTCHHNQIDSILNTTLQILRYSPTLQIQASSCKTFFACGKGTLLAKSLIMSLAWSPHQINVPILKNFTQPHMMHTPRALCGLEYYIWIPSFLGGLHSHGPLNKVEFAHQFMPWWHECHDHLQLFGQCKGNASQHNLCQPDTLPAKSSHLARLAWGSTISSNKCGMTRNSQDQRVMIQSNPKTLLLLMYKCTTLANHNLQAKALQILFPILWEQGGKWTFIQEHTRGWHVLLGNRPLHLPGGHTSSSENILTTSTCPHEHQTPWSSALRKPRNTGFQWSIPSWSHGLSLRYFFFPSAPQLQIWCKLAYTIGCSYSFCFQGNLLVTRLDLHHPLHRQASSVSNKGLKKKGRTKGWGPTRKVCSFFSLECHPPQTSSNTDPTSLQAHK